MRAGHVLGVAALLGIAGAASAQITNFTVALDGFQEVNGSGVPNQGDLDGFGTAFLTIDSSFSPPRISWNFVVNNIQLPLSLAHIHSAPAGSNGPVVVDFNAQLSGSGLADADLVSVLTNPTGFYINLHNSQFPSGALRGQIPTPGALGLMAVAAPLALRRRRR